MTIANYTELQTAVGRWLQRTDMGTMIPDFIAIAEADFNRLFRLSGQLTRETLTVSQRWTALSGLANTFLEIRTVKITAGGASYALEFVAPEMTHDFYVAGKPKFYTIAGGEIGVFPSPDGSYDLEVEYYAALPPLASNSTNWLLSLAPDVYLYRAVMEGAQYTHNPELMARVEAMFMKAAATLKQSDVSKQFGGSALAIRGD